MPLDRKPTRYSRLGSQDYRNGVDEEGVELKEQPQFHSRSLSDNFDAILEQRSNSSEDVERLLPKPRESVYRQRTFRQQHFSGWRVGAVSATVAASVVLILNISVTLWVTFSPFEKKSGIGTLLEGKCAEVKNASRWIHLVINVLSTILLSCSNYCMQVLSSPTREELVKAHNRRLWLHIGVPNLRNLLHIGKDRRNLFLLLAISSVPLHLLFNSVVFANIQANEYRVIPATPDFLNGATYNTTGLVPNGLTIKNATGTNMVPLSAADYSEQLVTNATTLRDAILNRTIAYENLTATSCSTLYSQQFVSHYGHVLVVADTISWDGLRASGDGSTDWQRFACVVDGIEYARAAANSSCATSIPFRSSPDVFPAWDWQCPPPHQDNCSSVDYDVLASQPGWAPYGAPVRYCLAELVDEHCRLQFSFAIAGAVVLCNAVKAAVMAFIVWRYRGAFLVTIGDAIASFLDQPDPETVQRCLYSRKVFEREWEWMRHNELKDPKAVAVEPERYGWERPFWGLAVSKIRWFATYFMYSVALIVGAVSIKKTLSGMPKDVGALWRTGFGDLIGNNLIAGSVGGSNVLGSVLIANLPQALLSYLYLCFNALYTCMLLMHEYTQYLTNRKPLRVTEPVGQQRSTYWLHLPYRYSVPLLVASGLLHWLASQSLFLVQVTVVAESRDPADERQISTCGYSPVAIILTTVVGSVVVLGGLLLALRRYPAGMPLASSCSATISAACHPPKDDVDAAVLPVQWGVVKEPGWREGEVGHCSFTSFPVTQLVRGRLYA